MGFTLSDTARLLEHARSSTRIAWVVLATLRRSDNVVAYPPDVIEATTGLGRGSLLGALTRLLELGLIVRDGEHWRLLTDFATIPPTEPELPLGEHKPPDAMPATPPVPVTTPDDLVTAWNTYAPALHPAKKLTNDRRKRAWARIEENPDVDWAALCARLNASRFCRGENSNGWRAGFDFLLRTSTVQKTLEGIYDDRPLSPVSLANAAAAATWLSARSKHARNRMA
jgi:hypothetical protein